MLAHVDVFRCLDPPLPRPFCNSSFPGLQIRQSFVHIRHSSGDVAEPHRSADSKYEEHRALRHWEGICRCTKYLSCGESS